MTPSILRKHSFRRSQTAATGRLGKRIRFDEGPEQAQIADFHALFPAPPNL